MKETSRYPLPVYIKFVIESFLALSITFFIARCLFFLFCKDVITNPIETLKAFGVGVFFDVVTISRLLFIPYVLLIVLQLFKVKKHLVLSIHKIFVLVLGFLCGLTLCANIPYYKQFKFHITNQILIWANNLDFVTGLIFGSFSYYGFIIVFFIIFIGLWYFLKRRVALHLASIEESVSKKVKIVSSTFLLLFLALASIGRFSSKELLHSGYAIISDNSFINNLGLNPVFTFIESISETNSIYVEPKDIQMKLKRVQKVLNAEPNSKEIMRIENKDSVFKNYNVVIVCMESMSSYKMGIHGHPTLTPVFNSLMKESIYFDRFFSSGIHTFNGIFSVLTGYPAIYKEHGLRHYTKSPFTTLANLLQQKNYETSFYSTHDPQFDNMEGFAKFNGFKNIYSNLDLPNSESISVTGVPDHVLFNLFVSKTNELKDKPFFSFIMTGSDHGPWAIPKDIPFTPTAKEKEMKATQYADWALGQLIEKCKKQTWFNNTIFVFVADHGYALSHCYEMHLSYSHIPFAIYQPSLFKPKVYNHLGYQPDVFPTLAGLLNLEFENTTFGIDLLREKHEFVCFSADENLACISNTGYYYFNIKSKHKKYLVLYDSLSPVDYYSSRSTRADSMENQAVDMIDVAQYLIRKKYFRK